MTKKDYMLIATELRLDLLKYETYKNSQPDYNAKYQAVWEMCYRLSHIFQDTNAKFDRNKFLKACGIV